MQNSFDDKLYPNFKKIVNSRNLKKLTKVSLISIIIFSSGFFAGFFIQQSAITSEIQTVIIPVEVPVEVTDLDRLRILQHETKKYWVEQEIENLELSFSATVSANIDRNFEYYFNLQISEMVKEYGGSNMILLRNGEYWTFSEFILTLPIMLFDFSSFTFTSFVLSENTVTMYLNLNIQDQYYEFVYDNQNGILLELNAQFYQSIFGLTEISIDFMGFRGSI